MGKDLDLPEEFVVRLELEDGLALLEGQQGSARQDDAPVALTEGAACAQGSLSRGVLEVLSAREGQKRKGG